MTKEKGLNRYQDINELLSKRLLEVFNSNESKLLIGVPKIFDNKGLEFRTETSKKWWLDYLKEHRKLWYKYLSFNKVYANTNFTRNYIVVKDKSICKDYFNKIKGIWNDRDIIIIEGKYSRLGIGNDLFSNSKSIVRILCPNENAFNKYNEILSVARVQNKDKLILIALGPTATVLAYDLYKLGFQVVDVGHMDIEYEWFLKGVNSKEKVLNKYTYEADGVISEDRFKNDEYEKQIISIIG